MSRRVSRWKEREWGLETDFERRISFALAKEITPCGNAGIDVLCEVEVDDSETWVAGRIWVTGDHTLRGWGGEHVE